MHDASTDVCHLDAHYRDEREASKAPHRELIDSQRVPNRATERRYYEQQGHVRVPFDAHQPLSP